MACGAKYTKTIVIISLLAILSSCASLKNKPPEPEGFQDYKTKNLNNFRAFASGTSSNRWGRSWFTTTPKQAMDKAMNFCEKTGEKCTVYALGDTIVKGMSPTEILAASEEYYISVSPGGANKYEFHEYHIIGVTLTAQEIIAHLSDKQVKGTNTNFLHYRGTWHSNGVIEAETEFLGEIERAPNDVGTWTVEDGKLCRKWERWLGGRHECLIVTKKRNILRGYDAHGDMIEMITLTGYD